MPSNADHIAQLIIKNLNDDITDAEKAELQAWVDTSENNKAIAEKFLVDENLLAGIKETYSTEKKIWTRLNKTISQPAKVRTMRPWIKWVAAALIVGVLATASIAILTNNHKYHTKPSVARVQDLIAPQAPRAVITLADGSKLYLDSAGNGVLAQQNNVAVVKNDKGEIVYNPISDQRSANSPVYNTLFNPRGSKVISLTLSDGTKVWLNSESSLRYPASFTGNTREVEITGEAYFDVKHNAKQPFKVHLPNGSIVEDIGTAFNVNAYTDEADIKTTLIEGSVRIVNGSQDHSITKSQILKPGQQALISNPANPSILKILVSDNVDVDEALSWKNGYFIFNSATTEDIMRQVARWYDADIVYEGNVKNERFAGSVPRTANVSQVLKVLELTKTVRFSIEGKKITVKPY